MNIKNLFCAIISLVFLWSCGKDDSPEPPKNNAPLIEAQSFTVTEDIADDVTIGTVEATDTDKDKLTFSISTNDNNLFEISDSGVLSLALGKSLNFSSKAQHQIVVSVTDGEDSSNGSITIKVTAVTALNQAPQLEDQSFDTSEDISDTDIIGTVDASDAEGDNLSYSITENDGELFEVDQNTGELSLAEGQNLDFELFEEHTITISVTDGTNISEATITIIVGNIADSLAEDSTSFVTKWKTEIANEEIVVGTNDELDLTYDYTIDWGDGTIENLTEGNPSHIYSSPGTYTVAINGQFPTIRIDKDLFDFEPVTTLISIEQWGTIEWKNLESAFHNCENMEYNASDAPDLSQITSLWNMFREVRKFHGADLNNWDVGGITNMTTLFYSTQSNLLDVSQWNVENVVQMGGMFGNTIFDGDLSDWDVGNVEDMSQMFGLSSSFNGDISSWNVSKVTNMRSMFSDARQFNQDISSWDVSNVIDMRYMFYAAHSFNQNINPWDVQNITNMTQMFYDAESFDQNLGGWDVSNVTTMAQMFLASNLSPENYGITLSGWLQKGVQQNVLLGADSINFCNGSEGETARTELINNYGWTITDDGGVDCQP